MALPGELPPLVELSDQTLWIRENTLALDRRVCGAPTCPLGGGFCFRCHPQQLGKVPSPSSSQAQPPFEMEHQFSSSLLVKIHPSPYWGRLGTQPPGDRATERTIGSRKDTPPKPAAVAGTAGGARAGPPGPPLIPQVTGPSWLL